MKRITGILMTVALLISLCMPVYAADETVVYVCDGGKGNGSSKDAPVGTLEKAYEILLEKSGIKNNADAVGVIVICDTLTIQNHFNYTGELTHKGSITYTSVYGHEDFGKTEDARLIIHADSKSALDPQDEHRFVLGGPTNIENLVIDRGEKAAVPLSIYAPTTLTVAESVEVIHTNWAGTYTEALPALTDEQVNSIVLSAHRGYQPMGPENSILAFEAAGKLGFDYIETDVIKTADGTLVCMHDATVNRTTNGTGKVTDMTFAELQKLTIDIKSYGFDMSSADQSKLYIPTFREYLEICKEYGAKPFIEIKDAREEVIHEIIDTALEFFTVDEIVMSCSSLSALEISYQYNRDIFHHLIWGDTSDAGYRNSIKTLSNMTDSNGNVHAGMAFNVQNLINKENYARAKMWIDEAHDAGLRTCLRGADTLDDVRLMFELGIDYYPTNTTTPEKLQHLKKPTTDGYVYSSANGGKIFIRGGRRSEVSEEDISITLLGGIFDFVAPSNAETPTSGHYSVTVGGNAFVNNLVAGETAKNATGSREKSTVTVQDRAEVRHLYVAGDYACTETVTVNILGGKVVSLTEGRGKGGRVKDVTVTLANEWLTPETVSLKDSSMITGKATIKILDEPVDDSSTGMSDKNTLPQENPPGGHLLLWVAIIVLVAAGVFVAVILIKKKSRSR